MWEQLYAYCKDVDLAEFHRSVKRDGAVCVWCGGGRGLTDGQNERVVTKQLGESLTCPFAMF